MEIATANRKFVFGDKQLVDPGPDMSPDEVMNFYSEAYPELTNGSISMSEISEDGTEVTYKFLTHAGDKG